MKFTVLGRGSTGNAVLVSSEKTDVFSRSASVRPRQEFVASMEKDFFTFFLIGCLMFLVPVFAVGQKADPRTVAVSFGGECEGEKYNFSSQLKTLTEDYGQQEVSLCGGEGCVKAFAYDLNGDKLDEYFIRMRCGGTGNCLYGIFSDHPARLRGTFTAWFFYVHKRNGSWSKISTYTREGGDQGFIKSWEYRRSKYTQVAERTEEYNSTQKPFYVRMGMPLCP